MRLPEEHRIGFLLSTKIAPTAPSPSRLSRCRLPAAGRSSCLVQHCDITHTYCYAMFSMTDGHVILNRHCRYLLIDFIAAWSLESTFHNMGPSSPPAGLHSSSLSTLQIENVLLIKHLSCHLFALSLSLSKVFPNQRDKKSVCVFAAELRASKSGVTSG